MGDLRTVYRYERSGSLPWSLTQAVALEDAAPLLAVFDRDGVRSCAAVEFEHDAGFGAQGDARLVALRVALLPAGSETRQSRRMVASARTPSIHAKPSPMHCRVPAPKGNQAKRGRAALSRDAFLGHFLGALRRRLTGEAIGIVAFGVGPPAGIVMDDDLRGDEHRALRDGEAAEGVGLGRGARRDPHRRIEAQGFCEVLPGERETRVVRCGGGLGGEDCARFFMQALLPLRVERGEPEREAEAIGGGLVAGEQEGEAFVAHLAIGHAAGAAFGIDGGDKCR